jgi:hypothetical protein
MLDERGFTKTESHFNEWNYLPGDDWGPMSLAGVGKKREQWFAELGGPRGAAFAATELMLLQDCPVDVANYYTGEIQGFGLFDFQGTPRKTYYAFKAFRRLLDCPVRVVTPEGGPGRMTVCAGRKEDGTAAAILVSNFNAPEKQFRITPAGLPWTGASSLEVFKLDSERNLQAARPKRVEPGQAIELDGLDAPAVVLILLSPSPNSASEPAKP